MAGHEIPQWRSSRRCEAGACVEVAVTGDAVLVRDGKDPEAQHLSFGYEAWRRFLAGLRDGTFESS
jgi:hypothetical protein